MRYGICTTCQSQHSVGWRGHTYFMHAHTNPWSKQECEGSWTLPEAVIGDCEEQRDADEWEDATPDYQDMW